MGDLIQDLRYGLRMLLKNPGFSVMAILALALGIGANSAVFSVINAALLRPLPYKDPDRLMIVWENNRQQGVNRSPASLLNFVDWREHNQSFEQMAALRISGFNLTSNEAEPERVQAAYATPSIFPLLGVKPLVGRTFLPEEERAGRDHVAVLSNGLWKRRFGGDPSIVDKEITLNSERYTVVGVLPPDFEFEQVGLWTPLTTEVAPNDIAAARSRRMYVVVARLKPGVSADGARAELGTLSARLAQEYPAANAGWGATMVPLHEQVVGVIRPALLVLFSVVALVLLIACANMANLLLARAATRQKEVAIRVALGATRGRLIRQLLTESMVLALLGGALGLLLTLWAKNLLVALLPDNPLRNQVGIDPLVLAFTLGVAVLTGLLFGLAPALQASRPNLSETLKEGGKTSSMGFGRQRVRSLLVAGEMTLALVLLIAAGLLLRSFLRLQDADPGIDLKNAVAMQVSLPPAKYKDAAQQMAFFHHVMQTLSSLPNVEAVSADSNIPLGTRRNSMSFYVEGRPPASPDQMARTEGHQIMPNYFRAMGIPLLRGRDFSEADVVGSEPVVIVNDALAQRFFPGEDPIGKRVSTSQPGQPNSVFFTIVGVAGNVRHAGLAAEPGPQMYWAYYQDPVPNMTVVVRTKTNPTSMASTFRDQIRSADRDIPSFSIRTLEEMAADSLGTPRLTMILLGFFAALALVLAAIGIYGIMSYSVNQRAHEIGVRMALGARPRDIIRLVLKQGMALILTGTILGLGLAFALTRLLSSLLYGVSSTDFLTFALAPFMLIAVALLACLVPARRATKVDPIIALRYE